MIDLTLQGREVNTVFDLLGDKENDLTYALGWAFSCSPTFTKALLRDVFGVSADLGEPEVVSLQEHDPDLGITDIEILSSRSHLIIEAKRGWILPGRTQLDQYVQRLRRSSLTNRGLLALTECSDRFATARLPARLRGQSIHHRSWRQIVEDAERARPASQIQRRHLRELVRYLKGVTRVQKLDSNEVYCVSLRAVPDNTNQGILTRELMQQRGIYLYPFGWGHGWPKEPPNYLAFRYGSKVQSVRHVDSYSIEDDLHNALPELKSRPDPKHPHVVCRLGPEILRTQPLLCGTNYRAARLKVALDLLLTAPTLKVALEQTKARFP